MYKNQKMENAAGGRKESLWLPAVVARLSEGRGGEKELGGLNKLLIAVDASILGKNRAPTRGGSFWVHQKKDRDRPLSERASGRGAPDDQAGVGVGGGRTQKRNATREQKTL